MIFLFRNKNQSDYIDDATLSFSSRKLPANSVWMEQLKLKNVLVCNPESRNIHNKIFGGWLMRQDSG